MCGSLITFIYKAVKVLRESLRFVRVCSPREQREEGGEKMRYGKVPRVRVLCKFHGTYGTY